jgi:hypothetical protein
MKEKSAENVSEMNTNTTALFIYESLASSTFVKVVSINGFIHSFYTLHEIP